MIRRTPVAGRPATVLGMLACVGAALALTPATAGACSNEQLRQQSRVNPATGQPYSMSLPDCRAYEMVSPSDKKSSNARPRDSGLPVAPDGNSVGFASEGSFAEAENEIGGIEITNVYTAHRVENSGWATSSAFAPANVIQVPLSSRLSSDFTPDLRSAQASCGAASLGKPENGVATSVVCARRKLGGPWVATPPYYMIPTGFNVTELFRLGASADLSRVFVRPGFALLPEDETKFNREAGIYEIAGMGTESPVLRLVNVAPCKGEETNLCSLQRNTAEATNLPPLFGDSLSVSTHGTAYHAVSESGETVFFAATPGTSVIESLYARIHCTAGSFPQCKEDGNHESLETVRVSAQSKACEEIPTCKASQPAPAIFEGASADGSKVFFTTEQRLVPEATNEKEEEQLYEYDFNKPKGNNLTLMSSGKVGQSVRGVIRSSSDGTHVYFVASGVLTEEANGNGEKASTGENIYGYDTTTGKLKFVAGGSVEGIRREFESTDETRPAQTTPDGRYLVFSTRSQLEHTGDSNTKGCPGKCPQAVYRYDFQTGELVWVSHAASGESVPNEGVDSHVPSVRNTAVGAEADGGDWERAISGCPKGVSKEESEQCPEGKFDGEYIVFTTSERLQANALNNAENVYEWHNGSVRMISDGRDPASVCLIAPLIGAAQKAVAGMSASGSDIFFCTNTPVVGQDTDVLGDIYDARVGGGFPAPAAALSCSGEGCQGTPSPPPAFGASTSSVFPASGTVSSLVGGPPGSGSLNSKAATKPLTQAQKLARALKACRAKPRKKRGACESQARRLYGKKANAKKQARAKKGKRRSR
jgi:hypothetical protein